MSSLNLWLITDGKPGHEKQTLGLANALKNLTPCVLHTLPVNHKTNYFLQWLFRSFLDGKRLGKPDLILAAGHRTHWPALAARRTFGGKLILCMRPSLPISWFDLCLIPHHDHPPYRKNVIQTLGALTNVVPGDNHDPKRGLILVGGPSGHFTWDGQSIAEQVAHLVAQTPEISWSLTTSRRSPADFLQQLQAYTLNIAIFPVEQTPRGWLEKQLLASEHAWASPDSVSMIYEALTAGCQVGIFNLRAQPNSRVAQGVANLAQTRWVKKEPTESFTPHPLDESARCAKAIISRWHHNLILD